MAVSLLGGCGDTPASTEAERSDADLDQQMLRDSAVDLHPPGARRVGGYEDGPCEGDSGSGPHVIRDYDWEGGPDELLSFYGPHVEGHGWRFVSREYVPSAGGDYELFLWQKPMGPYQVSLEVRTVRFEESDFDVILRATPLQDCT